MKRIMTTTLMTLNLLFGLLLLPVTPAWAQGCATASFTPPQNYQVGLSPRFVVTGDFNRDGKPDVATANRDTNNVSVLLNNGNGTFAAEVRYGVGTAPEGLTTGDFNGDGKLDLAAANSGSNFVSVLLGDGAGGFAPAINAAVPNPNRITAGDFNGDGKLDLATTQGLNAGVVHILLGNGNGTFAAPQNFGVGNQPRALTTGDFNGDGKPDLAVANLISNNVSVLLGNGDGTFTAAQNFGVGNLPQSVTAGDFNADGKLDLATANGVSTSVSVLFGNGDGTFAAAQNFFFASSTNTVTKGDFNGDGKTDLAAALGNDNIAVLLGNGDGTFAGAQNFATGSNPFSVTAADFNADGKLDLATANRNGNNVSVLLNTSCNNTAPTISAASVTRTAGSPTSNVQIATVNDAEDAENTLTVTATSQTGSGVTVTGITIDSDGKVTANVAASCTATTSTFNLQVTDSGTLSTTATLTVNVTANQLPVLSYAPNPGTIYGTGLTINPLTGPSDDLGITSIVVQSITPTNPGGITVNTTTGVVTVQNNVPAGMYTVTIRANAACGNRDASFTLGIVKATPVITWNNPANITCNTPLGTTQLNATANVLGGSFIYTPPAGTVLGLGSGQTLSVTYTPSNTANYNTVSKAVTINVVDTTAPTLTLKPNINSWQPNHKYNTVTMAQMVASVSDGCSNTLGIGSVVIEKVTSDEPDDVAGDNDGSTTNDILIAADCKSVQLRSERNQTLNGRVYVITLRVKDASGNTTRQDFKVSVPISQNGVAAVQDATAQTKTSVCP